jgi:hypothetical protein
MERRRPGNGSLDIIITNFIGLKMGHLLHSGDVQFGQNWAGAAAVGERFHDTLQTNIWMGAPSYKKCRGLRCSPAPLLF